MFSSLTTPLSERQQLMCARTNRARTHKFCGRRTFPRKGHKQWLPMLPQRMAQLQVGKELSQSVQDPWDWCHLLVENGMFCLLVIIGLGHLTRQQNCNKVTWTCHPISHGYDLPQRAESALQELMTTSEVTLGDQLKSCQRYGIRPFLYVVYASRSHTEIFVADFL